jgi:hypothetical protein
MTFSFANHTDLDNLRASMAAALANVEKEFGIKIQVGKMSYTAESVSMPLTAMVADTLLEGLDPKYVKELTKYRETKNLFKEETIVGGVKSVIVGMKPRTTGQQIIIRRLSDNSLRIVETSVARAGLVNENLRKAGLTFSNF